MPLLTSNILGYEADILSLTIAVLSLIFAIVVAVGGYFYNSRVLKANLRLDFSKRYQDLMTAMPEGPEFSEKYACLYFDLCAEEYRLHSRNSKMIGDYTWQLWEEGMALTLENHPELSTIWQKYRNDYATTYPGEKESFQQFFDGKFSPQSPEEV